MLAISTLNFTVRKPLILELLAWGNEFRLSLIRLIELLIDVLESLVSGNGVGNLPITRGDQFHLFMA